ncbi:MAG: S-methyl-5-thioribose-1-phosphate isomerase [Bdellovibrionaceae bacterium]|nr:S-methyl-5-thioribose-1-phosphate isomerase [Pseudobdellovibrionaceae bacterium]
MKRESLALKVDGERLRVLDQTKLPHAEEWIEIDSVATMVAAIQKLAVRGAPLIGVAAALTLAREAKLGKPPQALLTSCAELRASRPTAVNLMNLLDEMRTKFETGGHDPQILIQLAEHFFDEDVAMCERMANNAQKYIQDGDRILTHCNTGGLATVGLGTALGGIKKAHALGKKIHVYVDETRPLLQGARLTTWELAQAGIPFTLITDNMAGAAFQAGMIDKVFVGADRITVNGDVANKIGTYSVAVLAKHHGKDFFVVAPRTTFDLAMKEGREIPIEQRHAREVLGNLPASIPAWNPSFDMTPAHLIRDIITDSV